MNTRTHTDSILLYSAMLNMDWHKFYIVCVCKWERESHQVFVRAVLFACLFPQSTVMLLWWRNTYSGQLGVTLQTKYRSFKLTITHIHSCQLAWTVSQCFSVYDSRRCRRTVEIHSFIHFIRPNMLWSSSDFIGFFFKILDLVIWEFLKLNYILWQRDVGRT